MAHVKGTGRWGWIDKAPEYKPLGRSGKTLLLVNRNEIGLTFQIAIDKINESLKETEVSFEEMKENILGLTMTVTTEIEID